MPTTPNGNAYTVYNATLPTHGQCYWAVADDVAGDTGIPTVLYAHGSQAPANQFATLSAWTNMRNWLIDNGWAWIEGDGGAVSGSYNWGNAEARNAYPAYLEHVGGILDIGDVVLLGRSMGGLVTAWLCAFSDIEFAGWINNSGVSTMLVGTEVNAPSDATQEVKDAAKLAQCTAFYFGQPIRDAYGVSTYPQLKSYLQGAGATFCPETWDPSVWSGKNILNCYGDADVTVPWANRGGGPLREAWEGQPELDLVSIRPGGDHSGTNGSYLDVSAMADFLVTVTGGVVLPPEPKVLHRITASYVVLGGQRYPIAPKPMEVPPV